MGSHIEINDTLKLKRHAGFPPDLKVGERYSFTVSDRRLYHLDPIRVFLVEEINGLWLYHGHARILKTTIDAELNQTSGEFSVLLLYPVELRETISALEAPMGKGYKSGEINSI